MAHDYRRAKGLLAQALRYYGAAGSMAVLYLALFALGLAIHWHYFLAILAAQAVTISVAFPIYRAFVFQSQGRVVNDLMRFLSVWLSGALAGVVVTPILVELAGLNPLVAQIIAVAVVSIASFAAHRWFSFRLTSRSSASQTSESVPRPEGYV